MEQPAAGEGLTATVEYLGPKQAEHYLGFNTANRPVRSSQVNDLVETIRSGRWVLTHQGIALATAPDGETKELVDGQHRLKAIALAGVEGVPVMVTRGVGDQVWSAIDRGAKRTTGDEFARHGISNSTNVAAAAKMLYRYRNALWSNDRPIPDESVYQLLRDEPEIEDWVREGQTMKKRAPISPSVATAALYLSSRADLTETGRTHADWCDEIVRGVGVFTPGAPAKQLTDQLQNRRNNRMRTKPRDYLVIYGRAWSAWAHGADVGILRCHDTDPILDLENPPRPPRKKPTKKT